MAEAWQIEIGGKQWMPWQGGRFPVEEESWLGGALLGFLPEHL